jgi:hypothetical protein
MRFFTRKQNPPNDAFIHHFYGSKPGQCCPASPGFHALKVGWIHRSLKTDVQLWLKGPADR